MPALHGPLPPLEHVTFLFLWLLDIAEAATKALHYFPAVLWEQMVSEQHSTCATRVEASWYKLNQSTEQQSHGQRETHTCGSC